MCQLWLLQVSVHNTRLKHVTRYIIVNRFLDWSLVRRAALRDPRGRRQLASTRITRPLAARRVVLGDTLHAVSIAHMPRAALAWDTNIQVIIHPPDHGNFGEKSDKEEFHWHGMGDHIGWTCMEMFAKWAFVAPNHNLKQVFVVTLRKLYRQNFFES